MRVFMLLEEHMKETNIHYDLIICAKIDVKFISTVDFNTFKFNDNTIYIPFDSYYDHAAIGSIEVMKKYCELYKYMQYLLKNKLSIPSAEHLNHALLAENKIKIQLLPQLFILLV
jgi:hypothetical protein